MAGSSRRRQGSPLLVGTDSSERRLLTRVSLASGDIGESWLQALLFAHPEVLPVVEPVFAPLLSLGREVPTDAGPIDLLYINPDGFLTVVETKLWRNPEARRQVVAQTLDYAKEISAWTFEELDTRVRRAAITPDPPGVLGAVRAAGPLDLADEPVFIDRVADNLRCGRFLLMIVGDGIHTNVERLADFLQQHPTRQFTLGLVEMEVYRSSTGATLVVPSVVARTVEIERAVVRIEAPAGLSVTVEIPKENRRDHASQGRRFSLTEEEFWEALSQNVGTDAVAVARRLVEAMYDMDCDIRYGQASFTVRLADPRGDGWFTLFVVNTDGSMFAGWLGGQLTRAKLPVEPAMEYVRATGDLLGVGSVETRDKDTWPRWHRKPRLRDVGPVVDRFLNLVRRFVDHTRATSQDHPPG